MQNTRICTRLPHALRIVKAPVATSTRKMSLFPRFVSHDFPRIVNSDFAPVWRLLDDYANQVVSARHADSPLQSSFNPRFDVKEVQAAYELKGELPGVEQKNIEIEFPDQQTIVIKGATGYSREETSPAETEAESEETASVQSHQATVEDEPELIDAAEAESTADTPQQTPAETPVTQAVQPAQKSTPPSSTSKYWLSERYTGSFQRTFTFPAPVDTENAKAKLRNGVLEVTIPKIQKAGIRRINIE